MIRTHGFASPLEPGASPGRALLHRVAEGLIAFVMDFASRAGLGLEHVAVFVTNDPDFARGLGLPLSGDDTDASRVMTLELAQRAADHFWPGGMPGLFLAPTPPGVFRVLVYTAGVVEVLTMTPQIIAVPKGVGDA